jgi:FemAB-related protein (PEP-CTERM system-associated)
MMGPSALREPDSASRPTTPAADCTVARFTARDRDLWNSFVLEHPAGTFFHRAEWESVVTRAFGHRAHYMYAERDGRVCGVLPLVEVKSVLFGHSLVSTPFCVYGGIIAADAAAHAALERAACALGTQLGVDYVEMRNRSRAHPQWPCKDLYVTFRRPIAAEAEQNMLAIPRKQRAMVRKGIQKSLDVEIDAGTERMYSIYSESLRNLGTPVFSARYPRLLKEAFGADCEVLTVLCAGQPIASVLSFYFRGEVLPYYGGSTSAARSVAGNDFMYWQVMERARERGAQLFDFGRSKRDTGSFDFKAHWGFEPQPLYYEYFLVAAQAMPDLSPKNPKYGRMIDLWRRLPLPLTRLFGPPIARYLG